MTDQVSDVAATSGLALAVALPVLRQAGWCGPEPALVVDGPRQRLYCVTSREPPAILLDCPVSTGKAGFGCRENSGQTPVGLHRIHRKIGSGLPVGAILKGREFTGAVVSPSSPRDADWITTRILWLEGEEPGVNRGGEVDSCQRYIYLHGTPRADLIGTPASQGCVRLLDQDILSLFDQVQEGTWVYIHP